MWGGEGGEVMQSKHNLGKGNEIYYHNSATSLVIFLHIIIII